MKQRKAFPSAKVRLSGENENVFHVIGSAAAALQNARVSEEEIRTFCQQAVGLPSYSAILAFVSNSMEIE